MVPVDGSHGGLVLLARPHGRGDASTPTGRPGEDIAAEIVPRVLHELSRAGHDRHRAAHRERRARSASCPWPSWPSPEPSEPDLRFLSTLAGLTAQALERAQVFEHEREALRAAEAGRERLSLLSEVTRLLSSSLEPTTVIRRTMSLVEGRLADSCIVQVPGDSGLVRLDVREPEAARRTGGRAAAAQRERPLRLRRTGRRRLPHGPDAAGPARRRTRTGGPTGSRPPRSPSR